MLTLPFPLISCDIGVGCDDEESLDLESLLDIAERVERAIERILAVSEPRGAEVGPGVLVVASVDMEPEFELLCEESPLTPLFGYGRDGDEEAAEDGERSSGVEDRVLVSIFDSSGCRAAPTCGVPICDGIGVGGLLYTPAGWKVFGVERGRRVFVVGRTHNALNGGCLCDRPRLRGYRTSDL